MKNDLDLDFDLSEIQLDNKTQKGLLDGLDDILTNLLEPLDGDKWKDTSNRSMVLYGLRRNQETIQALLRCLKSTTESQANKLERVYKKYIESGEQSCN